ncbi:Evasin [Dirofilaria immitis]
MSFYILLSGFQLPWRPSCCLYQPNFSWDLMSGKFGTLRLVHPNANPPYQMCPVILFPPLYLLWIMHDESGKLP